MKREQHNPDDSKDYRFHIWVFSPHNRNWGVSVTYINGFFNILSLSLMLYLNCTIFGKMAVENYIEKK